MITCNNLLIAKHGEDLAVSYLEGEGYEIIERNWRLGRGGEIDIVASDDGLLVFVEVKTRCSDDVDAGMEAISYGKRRQLLRLARCYLAGTGIADAPGRLDVIIVTLGSSSAPFSHPATLTHVIDAFGA